MIFNDAQIHGMKTGEYFCPMCKQMMEFEDECRDTLVCPNCGYDEPFDRHGFTDEEYDALYPTKEEVCGYDGDDDPDDEYNGESYDEVYGELSDD